MSSFDIYNDIALRTNGDIYVGVVGPVRTGKSTLITKLLDKLVLPNIMNINDKERTIDEMPQSGDGKSIMTTQPKFIPNEAVKIKLENDIVLNMRLIDCVGFLVDGALGHIEDEKPRLVKTPWQDDDIPFEKAAQIGTEKVIKQHSTIGVMVTTDGSIAGIPRENYVSAEEKVVTELKNSNKPFIIVLNSTHPSSPETIALSQSLEQKYKTSVLVLDVAAMTDDDINDMFSEVLQEFPIATVSAKMPKWMQALPFSHPLIEEVTGELSKVLKDVNKIGDVSRDFELFLLSENFEPVQEKEVILGKGAVVITIVPKADLFYKVLSEQCGADIESDYHLVSYIKQLSVAKAQYEKFKHALEQVDESGYGVVYPSMDELTLEEPKIIKQGNKFGVKLKAGAPSLHIMQVDLDTEVNSLVGNEQQSEELVKYLMGEFENNPHSIWETKLFGTSLHYLVNEGLHNKLVAVQPETMKKMRRTMGRIVNEGKGGVICILL